MRKEKDLKKKRALKFSVKDRKSFHSARIHLFPGPASATKFIISTVNDSSPPIGTGLPSCEPARDFDLNGVYKRNYCEGVRYSQRNCCGRVSSWNG